MEWVELAMGPMGALALAVPLAVVLLRRLDSRYADELVALRAENSSLRADVTESRKALEVEHGARLADAKESTKSLLGVYERVHETLDGLEALVKADRAKSEPPRSS
jgi:hypothetical protein